MRKVLTGAAIAVPLALWLSFFPGSEELPIISQDDPPSDPPQSLKALETVVSSHDSLEHSTVLEELELSPVLDAPSDMISIGEYIDPERGADLSQPIAIIEIGEFIDPDRGADYSEPSNPIEIGEYIDPDRGAVLEVNPLEVLSIGAFIDPDSLSVAGSQVTVEVGEYVDPDRD